MDDEPAARERDEVLDPAVGADRGHGRLDVVDPDAVLLEHLVVRVELLLQPPEVGVARGARVVVLPLLRVLGPNLVLRRPRDEHLAQRADPLRAPATAPDLLDLVVEVRLVEHVVPQRLARLEPRQRLEHGHLVVAGRLSRRHVRELHRVAGGRSHAEWHRLPALGVPWNVDTTAHQTSSPRIDGTPSVAKLRAMRRPSAAAWLQPGGLRASPSP